MNKEELESLESLAEDCQTDVNDAVKETHKILPNITCPEIDKVLKSLSGIESTLRNRKRYDSVEALADDIETDLYGLDDKIEDLRKANEALRTLSSKWREVAEANQTTLSKFVGQIEIPE